ncbi:MAG: TolC family protein [Desulfobacteraceae bacterium]|nr:MAG: TolC family protein [Desulfobacteraceae bacterium]
MKQPKSAERGEFFPPPFFIVTVIFFVAGIAFAAAPEVDTRSGADQPLKIVLTLDQAVNLAMQANRGISSSQYNAESRRYSIDAARALFDLKLISTGGVRLTGGDHTDYNYYSAGLRAEKKLESGTTISMGPQITQSSWESRQYYTTGMGITVMQPLLRGRGEEITTDSVQSADAAYQTSLRNVYQTKVNTVLETIATFYDAIRQVELLRLFENMEARLKGHSEIARVKEKVGLATPMDTYRAEIPLKEVQDAMITASEAFQDAKDRLKLILALPQHTQLEVTFPEAPDFRELSREDAVDTALKKRIEIEQLEQDMAEAERKAAVAKHNILPDLNLVMGYDRYAEADTFGQSTSLDLDRYLVLLQTDTDIFRTAERAAYQQSLIVIKTLRLNMKSKKEDISRQVRKQWLSLQEALKRMEIRKAQIKQGEEKIALAEVKFAHQMADNFDVIEAEKELQSARGNLLAAEIDFAIGIYNMKAILGVLVPRN